MGPLSESSAPLAYGMTTQKLRPVLSDHELDDRKQTGTSTCRRPWRWMMTSGRVWAVLFWGEGSNLLAWFLSKWTHSGFLDLLCDVHIWYCTLTLRLLVTTLLTLTGWAMSVFGVYICVLQKLERDVDASGIPSVFSASNIVFASAAATAHYTCT
jgi:hypothetical protein